MTGSFEFPVRHWATNLTSGNSSFCRDSISTPNFITNLTGGYFKDTITAQMHFRYRLSFKMIRRLKLWHIAGTTDLLWDNIHRRHSLRSSPCQSRASSAECWTGGHRASFPSGTRWECLKRWMQERWLERTQRWWFFDSPFLVRTSLKSDSLSSLTKFVEWPWIFWNDGD